MKIKINIEAKISKKDLKQLRKAGVDFSKQEMLKEMLNRKNKNK